MLPEVEGTLGHVNGHSSSHGNITLGSLDPEKINAGRPSIQRDFFVHDVSRGCQLLVSSFRAHYCSKLFREEVLQACQEEDFRGEADVGGRGKSEPDVCH